MSNPLSKVNTHMKSECQFGPGGFHTVLITSKDPNDRRCFEIRYDDADGTPEGQIYTIGHTMVDFETFDDALSHLVTSEKI
jgi:hypothetical protein